MTDWTGALDALASACVDAFADEVTLPSGEVAQGIFDPLGQPPASPWSDVGLAVRVSDQPSPTVVLLAADAALLAEQDVLGIRGVDYLITRMRPAAGGLVTVELMPAATATHESARWR